ncbi:MAG TPA: prolyl oligopeptidase family serine peptidase, partial [Thermoanaerobaculia bacterium]
AGRLLVADGPDVRLVPLGRAASEAAAPPAPARLPGPALLRRALPDGSVLLLVSRSEEPATELLVPTGREAWEIVRISVDEAGAVRVESRARGPALPDGYPQALAADGRRVVVWRAVGPGAALVAHDLASGESVELLGPDGVAKRRVAWLPAAGPLAEELLAVRATATAPETLVRVGLDGLVRPVAGRWPGVAAALPVGAVETVRWRAPDGEEIEGVLVTPDDGGRGRPYPTLLYLHGGPDYPIPADLHYLASGSSQSAAHLFARAGYAVLVAYFRGSGGYGDRFAGALGDGRLYSAPAADALAGIDALVERGISDPERLGVYGHSFGGMLTAWIVARDHRFQAAISSVGFLDTLAADRMSGRAFHASPGLGGPEDDSLDPWTRPERYRELSPLERAFEVETPTLLVSTAGEQDHLAGYAAFFNALRLREVPTLWLHFPGANHTGSWSPAEQRDYAAHALAWFDRFLGAVGESSGSPGG